VIKVEIGNSMSQVVGLSPEQFMKLRAALSIREEGYGYSYVSAKTQHRLFAMRGYVFCKDTKGIPCPVGNNPLGHKKYRRYKTVREAKDAIASKKLVMYRGALINTKTLLSKKGEFATGLLYLVYECIDSFYQEYQVKDTRIRPTKPQQDIFTLSMPVTPYPEQIEAAKAASRWSRGIIAAPTGSGKSVVAALVINELQVRTLLVVPTLELKRQLTESLQAAFPATTVGSLEFSPDIAVENVAALDTKKKLTGYDCVIIDEFHHAGSDTYLSLNKKAWVDVYHRVALTATPYRSRSAERLLLESVLSQVIYKVEYKDAVANGRIVPLEAFYFTLPRTKTKLPKSWPNVYREMVVENEYRNFVIADFVKTLEYNGFSTLVLVKEVRHGEILQELTGASFAHGDGEDCAELIKQFSNGDLKTLIGTTGVIGEGVDSRAAEWVILCGGGRSRNQFVQQCGRVFRRFKEKEIGKIVLFNDPSSEWLKEHFRLQCTYLKEEFNIEPSELELPKEIK